MRLSRRLKTSQVVKRVLNSLLNLNFTVGLVDLVHFSLLRCEDIDIDVVRQHILLVNFHNGFGSVHLA